MEGLHERAVGNGQVLVAAAEQDAGTGVEGQTRRVRGERGLPHSGVPGDQDDLPTVSRGHPFEGVGQHVGLGLSTDEADRGRYRQARRQWDEGRRHVVLDERIPTDLQDLERFGQTLQLHLPESPERVGDASPRHHLHELGGEDLATLGPGAESSGLDDRVAKVVVALARGLAGAQSHAQARSDALPPIASIDALLHRHCARQRGGAAAEDDHDAVSEVLYLRASRGRDRPAQLREECPAHRVGGLGRGCGRRVNLLHKPREQDRDILRLRHPYSRSCSLTHHSRGGGRSRAPPGVTGTPSPRRR